MIRPITIKEITRILEKNLEIEDSGGDEQSSNPMIKGIPQAAEAIANRVLGVIRHLEAKK